MSIKCDFCDNDSLTINNMTLVSSHNGIHICEECVQKAVNVITNAKNNSAFKQALNKTKEKHANVINQLARQD